MCISFIHKFHYRTSLCHHFLLFSSLYERINSLETSNLSSEKTKQKNLTLICFHVTSFQHGISHAFVSEFENEMDRKYYLEEDPAHLDFVKSIGEVIARVTVVDFVPGEF